jgi:GxxExxY protein
MGDFIADLVIQEIIVIELKAVESLMNAHSVQLVNYLCATRIDVGLLLNFGSKSLQFKTKTREYNPHKIPSISAP